MHFCLYLCVPRSAANTSRRAAAEYVDDENFASETRFGGVSDYFGVGGRWSGRLELLRLKDASAMKFRQFWTQFENVKTPAQEQKLFKKTFPEYTAALPVARSRESFLGDADDAQIMDAVLFRQLKRGFSEYVDHSWEPSKPNVPFTDLGEGEWHDVEVIDEYWVV